MRQRAWALGRAWLFLFLVALYLLGYSPLFHSSDGLAMFAVTENVVRRGHWDISQLEWMGLQQGTYGPDGLLYCRKGPGTSLAALPLAWLGHVVPGWGMASAALLLNVLVTAGTAVLLAAWLERAGYGPRVGLAVALAFGAASLAWPYAKTFFSEPLTAFGLMWAAYSALAYRSTGRAQDAFLAGVGLGVSMTTRMANAVVVPLVGLSLWWPSHAERAQGGVGVWARRLLSRHGRAMLAWATPVALSSLFLLTYNAARFGSPWISGYLPQERFSGNWLQGVVGLLVSPGRGLLLYVPVLWFALLGWRRLWIEHRRDAVLWAAVAGLYVLLYGKWFMWHGGYAWGPRFLVPVVPLLFLGLAPWLAERHGRLAWSLFGLAAAVSVVLAVLGASVHFALVQEEYLREGLPLFAPETFFHPRYSPLVRQWRYMLGGHLDAAWALAEGWGGGLALAAALAALAWASVGLVAVWRGTAGFGARRWPWALGALLLAMAMGLMTRTAYLWLVEPWEALMGQVARWERPGDVFLCNRPEETAALSEAYGGRAWVVNLQEGEGGSSERAVWWMARILSPGARVWWLPDWRPPERSAVERALMAQAFRVLDLAAGDRRAALYVVPAEPLPTREVMGDVPSVGILMRGAWTPSVRPGEPVLVELTWQASRTPPGEDLVVYVHLVDGNGRRVAGHDGMPALWLRPTSTWRAGEMVVDRHGFPVPEDLPPGPYGLRVGLYRLSTGERVPTAGGEDGFLLGKVVVLPAP